ncbi:Zinc ABC transporter substrate-binding protein [Candidatus Hepatincolaceae symbiont of Richtersius coronifer]
MINKIKLIALKAIYIIILLLVSFNNFKILNASETYTLVTINQKSSNSFSSSSLKVQASISPIYSLVAMITKGIIAPGIILDSITSPHHMELTYKQISKIKSADILFVVSKNLESGIVKIAQDNKIHLIVLEDSEKLVLYPFNNESFNKPQKLNSPNHNNHSHNHNDNPLDYHYWLDPHNAKILLSNIAKHLSTLDPTNAPLYNKNLVFYQEKLDALDKDIKKILDFNNKNSAFKALFYHNAWQYYVKRYNISFYATIATEDDHHHLDTSLSTRDILQLTDYVKNNKINCIFTEKQFEDKVLTKFAQKNQILTATLDPLGYKDAHPEDIYFDVMKKNTQIIKNCSYL